jgi:hypothetical protein
LANKKSKKSAKKFGSYKKLLTFALAFGSKGGTDKKGRNRLMRKSKKIPKKSLEVQKKAIPLRSQNG